MIRHCRILTRQTSESFGEVTGTCNMMQNGIEPGVPPTHNRLPDFSLTHSKP